MGIDGHLQELVFMRLWMEKIHSFADNDDAGNYGPTLI
jgi:hypothetical protein